MSRTKKQVRKRAARARAETAYRRSLLEDAGVCARYIRGRGYGPEMGEKEAHAAKMAEERRPQAISRRKSRRKPKETRRRTWAPVALLALLAAPVRKMLPRRAER